MKKVLMLMVLGLFCCGFAFAAEKSSKPLLDAIVEGANVGNGDVSVETYDLADEFLVRKTVVEQQKRLQNYESCSFSTYLHVNRVLERIREMEASAGEPNKNVLRALHELKKQEWVRRVVSRGFDGAEDAFAECGEWIFDIFTTDGFVLHLYYNWQA